MSTGADLPPQVRWAVLYGKLGHGSGHLVKAEPKANSSRVLSAWLPNQRQSRIKVVRAITMLWYTEAEGRSAARSYGPKDHGTDIPAVGQDKRGTLPVRRFHLGLALARMAGFGDKDRRRNK